MPEVLQEEPRYVVTEELHPRRIDDDKRLRLETCASEIVEALGLDLNTPATKDTPRRFIQALIDATEGYEGDPKLIKVFKTECHGGPDCQLSQIIEGPIHFFAMCELADLLVELLQPHGVAVYLEAHHLCVEMRGVRDITPTTRTTFWRGEYENNPNLRSAFFTACGLQR